MYSNIFYILTLALLLTIYETGIIMFKLIPVQVKQLQKYPHKLTLPNLDLLNEILNSENLPSLDDLGNIYKFLEQRENALVDSTNMSSLAYVLLFIVLLFVGSVYSGYYIEKTNIRIYKWTISTFRFTCINIFISIMLIIGFQLNLFFYSKEFIPSTPIQQQYSFYKRLLSALGEPVN